MRRALVILLICCAAISFSACRKKKTPPVARTPRIGLTETGIASWYGHPYHGRRAASGEVYDMEKMTAAHRTLAFGTSVRVRNLDNGKSCDVRITDRGPFVDGRIIDLSKAAARSIDMIGPGVAKVEIEVTGFSSMESAGVYAVQAGSFAEKQRAEKLAKDLRRSFQPVEVVERDADRAQWRVIVGRRNSLTDAQALAGQIRERTGAAFVVRVDRPD
jgi:rare lipoprotein A